MKIIAEHCSEDGRWDQPKSNSALNSNATELSGKDMGSAPALSDEVIAGSHAAKLAALKENLNRGAIANIYVEEADRLGRTAAEMALLREVWSSQYE